MLCSCVLCVLHVVHTHCWYEVSRHDPPTPALSSPCFCRQETIKAGVFKPQIAPPTMTLEEFARLEMEDAVARQQREQEAAAAQGSGTDHASLSTRCGGDLIPPTSPDLI